MWEILKRSLDKVSISVNEVELISKFSDYLEQYPCEDEPGYDGVHDGGIIGLCENAPESAQKAYTEYQNLMEKCRKEGIKI